MKAARKDNPLHKALGYLHQYPALLVSGVYVLLTFAGIVFTSGYYRTFGIPFLQLADLSDFMIAGITEPMAIVLVFSALLLALAADYSYVWVYRHWGEQIDTANTGLKARLLRLLWPKPSMISYVLLLLWVTLPYSWAFISNYANWKGHDIQQGNGTYIQLELRSGTAPVRPQILLGSTVNYLFVFDPQLQQAGIYPVENVRSANPAVVK